MRERKIAVDFGGNIKNVEDRNTSFYGEVV